MTLEDAIAFITEYKTANPDADKADVQSAFVAWSQPRRARSVWVCDEFSIRFSQASENGFSNTVLSLSALKNHDALPFIVALVRERDVRFFISNTTFLKKISHSSHHLRVDNIKGSFNGTDIMIEYEGVANGPENFELLFAQHSAFTWEENLERLVEATNEIIGHNRRYQTSKDKLEILLDAPNRAAAALSDTSFKAIEAELGERVDACRDRILEAARVENVNLRGNAIEQLLTDASNAHELGDLEYVIGGGGRLVIDIKTKLMDKASAPKAYNVDKMLSFLSEPGSVFALLMIGVSLGEQTVSSRLLPIFESALLEATVVQHHWAGRTSRGVTQLSGRFGRASAKDYNPTIDLAESQKFLTILVDL